MSSRKNENVSVGSRKPKKSGSDDKDARPVAGGGLAEGNEYGGADSSLLMEIRVYGPMSPRNDASEDDENETSENNTTQAPEDSTNVPPEDETKPPEDTPKDATVSGPATAEGNDYGGWGANDPLLEIRVYYPPASKSAKSEKENTRPAKNEGTHL